MPELPEVETTLRGLQPHLLQHRIVKVDIRDSRLRWPVPAGLPRLLRDQTVESLSRRGKYLIFAFNNGYMLLHLGMSGSLRIVANGSAARKHDHIDWQLENGLTLRFHDPRRFGSIHWSAGEPLQHPLLAALGPEPLSPAFSGTYLYSKSRRRKTAVKNFIMDAKIVVGVGNIYASEALFKAGIHPNRQSGGISLQRYRLLAAAVKKTLRAAIRQGGTTLRDFVNEQGNPGYFRQRLQVYERDGLPCTVCGRAIKRQRIGQRSSYYCSHCQR